MSPADVEEFVKTSWNADADDYPRIDSVQCDDGLENKLGDRASCSLTMTDDSQAAGTLEVLVVENDDGDLVPTYITGEPTVGPPGIDVFN